MRVLHVQKATGVGGSERHLVDLLAGQLGQGLDVRMCVLAAGNAHRFESALEEARVPSRRFSAGATVSPSVLVQLAAEVRRFRPDLVHTHLIHADVHGQTVARLLGVPAVSTIHGPQPFYRHYPVKAAARLAGHLARRTIVISEYLRTVVAAQRLAPRDRVRVVHYGVDVRRWELADDERRAARAELGLTAEHIAVGIASRLVSGKGHERLIEAVASARRRAPALVLIVAGDGARRQQLEELAARQAPGAVTFVGYLPNIARFLHASDVVAVPTQPELGEGFGLVALEAMACGRPTVVSAVASLPEVIGHGEAGLVVPPDDVGSLAEALVGLCEPGLRRRMGDAARARAIGTFSLDAMVSRTVDVYGEALGGRGAVTDR